MSTIIDKEILELKKSTLSAMESYMKYGAADNESDPDYDENWDAGYTQEHIDECDQIISSFFVALSKTPEKEKNKYILDSVKSTVLKLNRLNEKSEDPLIETDAREDLCTIIEDAAIQAGLKTDEDDITEEWREW